MSEEIIPDVELTSDVVVAEPVENAEPAVNYSEKTLAELIRLFEELVQNEERMKMSKEAEAIKSAFYKRLQKEKAEAGLVTADPAPEAEETEETEAPAEDTVSENPFAEVERGFKDLYNKYKKERAEYNRQLEKEREDNLAKKEAVIADLKALLEKQEDVNATFPEFREIQNRWRAIGPVPAQSYRNINETYQLYVEQFYDMVKINRELRDLDFKKNLEAKEQFCAYAEKLAENPNVVEAFRELQKLHEQWKEFGPVAKEYRDQIWDRFKAATAVINKKYQAFFEGIKEQQAENLVKKTALCEKVEEIAEREVTNSNEWNAFSKEIEDVQKEWKTIGFASKKENQKIYDRFRAACDKFYGRKRDFYTEYKDSINANLEKKISLCEAAEALKSSTEWKKATDQFINLQKQWKEIGAVPRKKSEQLWKRFRAACDEFFAERDKNAKPENDFYGNLKAKQRLIEEIKAYEIKNDDSDAAAMQDFQKRWQEIGFVPFKEKDNIAQAYKEALNLKFPNNGRGGNRRGRGARPALSEKDRLIQKYNQLEQDIVTYENNIGFFSMSKNSAPLVKQMEERIAQSKEELKALAEQIRVLTEAEEQE
ncbi:MAG: DUF349 domain-containing protein [Bacteroidales bacterium]|nr:DUF349 domain-containing protein [Bacteroidales bacterium]MBR1959634.1 DUF349 domain-containing protein [Bacteroidales bacterium]